MSSEIGACKPDQAVDNAVLDHPGLDPAQTVFVDDRPTNLVAAQAVGFQPVLFHSEDTDAHLEVGFAPRVVHRMPELFDCLTGP